MRKFIVRYRKAVVISLALMIYFTVLTMISFMRTTELAAAGENLADYQNIAVWGEQDKAWADNSGLHFRDSEGTEKVFNTVLMLQDIQQIQVQFTAECPPEFDGTAVLHVDLYAEGYDAAEQEFAVELKAGQNEVSQIIDKGTNAPPQVQFRIFCLDPVQCDISSLSVQQMKEVTHSGTGTCVIVAIVLAILLLFLLLAPGSITRGEARKSAKREIDSKPKRHSRKEHIKSLIPPSALLAFTFFVFGPIQLYITNADELFFSLSDFWWICVIVGLIAFGVLIGLGDLFGTKFSMVYTCALWGVALGLYIQGNFIFVDYGTLDGSTNWEEYTDVAVWDSIIWVMCLIVPFLLQRIVPKAAEYCRKYVSFGIIAVEAITLCTLLLTTDLSHDLQYSLTNEKKLELSSKHNIVVFVVDAYDSNFFSDFIEKYPEYKETTLKNFTYYPDTVGGAARTVLAMPQILTGKFYTDESDYLSYLRDGYQSTKLYEQLHSAGYNIGIYTEKDYIVPELGDLIVNISTSEKGVNSYPKLAYCLFRFTACRYFPHILKESVWMYSGDFDMAADNSGSASSAYLINDPLFYQSLTQDKVVVQNDENVFRLYHLTGAHEPYYLNARCERSFHGTSLEEQQKGIMLLLKTYFSQMKELGVYDNADIIILADHGEIHVGENPLLLIKHGTATSEFTIDDVPVSYTNLQATLSDMASLNIENGKSIFELTESDNTKRYFYLQTGDYASEFVVEGNVTNKENVSETGNTFRIFGREKDKIEEYELGTELYFDIRATGTQYEVKGFSKVETDRTWADGSEAVLSFPLAKQFTHDVFVSIDLVQIMNGNQHIDVYINDMFLDRYLAGEYSLRFTIPKEMVPDKQLTIRLGFPNATTAEADSRLLSLAFRSMKITERQESDVDSKIITRFYSLGDKITFTNDSNGCIYFAYGIWPIEGDFAWSLGCSGKILIPIEEDTGDLASEWAFKMIYGQTQRFIVRCGDLMLYDAELSSTEEHVRFTIPASCVKDGWLTLDLEYPNAVSPKDKGVSDDLRELAFAFESIRFYPIKET